MCFFRDKDNLKMLHTIVYFNFDNLFLTLIWSWQSVEIFCLCVAFMFSIILNHMPTYPKGVHWFRHFLSSIFSVICFSLEHELRFLTNLRDSVIPFKAFCLNIDYTMPIFFLMQNVYMHEQLTKEFVKRKYLNECSPFGYVSLWNTHESDCRMSYPWSADLIFVFFSF